MEDASARRRLPVKRRATARPVPVRKRLKPAVAGNASLDLGPLPGLVGYVLRRAQVAVFQDFARSYARFDIRPVQYAALVVIDSNPGQKQIAVGSALGIKRANFVALCDELERRGLIERRGLPNDRRSYALHLTTKGADLLTELHATNLEHEARIAAALASAGRDGFMAQLKALAALGTGAAEGES
jgi:DNA-binding MarR family transcriptional regulator